MKGLKIRSFEPADHAAVLSLHRAGLEQTGADRGPGPWDDDLATPDSIRTLYLVPGGEFAIGLIDDDVVAMGALFSTGVHRRAA